uniref:Uncharacterized protein n=1 Tax=Marseillevirus LCMAC201 TaxID=2506605 RepID=A0A481YWJ1_9VIRU|nr:MAG: hypothetical protein LCMAC201_03990 [Marseillevirus LCMAC201]
MSTVVIVSTVIGKGLLAGALADLYLFIKSSTYNEQLEQVLRDLDIKAELDVVRALLDDLANITECRVVKVSSDQVKESVELIHRELQEIQQELEYHKTRYFYYWRIPSYDRNIRHLRNHRDILRKRRELLISILGVQRKLHRRSTAPSRRPPKQL